MNTNPPLKISNLEFLILTADVLVHTGSNRPAPGHSLEKFCICLELVERAWIDIAPKLTEPTYTGSIVGGREYETVTVLVSNGQQIGLFIKETSLVDDDNEATIRHWSDYPDEKLEDLLYILISQVSTWYFLARDICVSDGSLVTPFDRTRED